MYVAIIIFIIIILAATFTDVCTCVMFVYFECVVPTHYAGGDGQ